MDLNEFIEIARLLDIYGNLLKEKQRQIMIQHFEEDLSLSEIAKHEETSRQTIYDAIKRGTLALKEYEIKLGILKKDDEIKLKLMDLKKSYCESKIDEILNKLL